MKIYLFKTISNVFHYTGILLLQLSFFFLLPLVVVVLDQEYTSSLSTTKAFVLPLLGSILIGFFLCKTCKRFSFTNSTPFLICTFVWILFSIIGGIPLYISLDIPFINALFEGTAGFTTTGTTILDNVEVLPRSILLWRSLMQWLGGIGIIAFFLAFQSGIPGSHKLYSAESSKLDIQRPVPGLVNTLRILWKIYLVGTGLMIFLLWVQRVPIFIAINHSLTCISTGGFSTFNSSIQAFQTLPGVQFTLVQSTFMIGMIFGSTNFLLHFRFFTGQWKAIFDTKEIKTWILIMGTCSVLLILFAPHFSFMDSIFQTISLSSTTGYTLHPFSSVFMTPIVAFLFFLLMFIGGCNGSTTGGVKVQRILLIGKVISREVKKLWVPEESILPIVIDQRIVPENAVQQALTIISIWVLTILVGALLLILTSPMSLKTAFSAQLSAVSNIGPSFLDPVTLASSNWFVKTILKISMIAGRIEILPLLLLFQRKAWA